MLQQTKKKSKDLVLEYLTQHNGVEQKTLQDVLGLKQNSLSMLLKRMEANGLIEKKNMKLTSSGKGGKLHAKLIYLIDQSEKPPKPTKKKPKPKPKTENNDDMGEGIDFDDKYPEQPPPVENTEESDKEPLTNAINGLEAEIEFLKTDNISLIDQKVEQQQRIEKLQLLLGETEQSQKQIELGDINDNIKEMLRRFPDDLFIQDLEKLLLGQDGQYKKANEARYRKSVMYYHYGLSKIKGT